MDADSSVVSWTYLRMSIVTDKGNRVDSINDLFSRPQGYTFENVVIDRSRRLLKRDWLSRSAAIYSKRILWGLSLLA